MIRDNFAVFILTHGRADRVYTLDTLQKCGYTGKWYIVIDDEDSQVQEYYRKYGDNVIRFCKKSVAEITDTGDASDDRRVVVFARNECFEIAKQIGIRYFLELDDDYSDFEYRYIQGEKLKVQSVKNLDDIFENTIQFLDDSGALTVTYAQGGDYIGGAQSEFYKKGLSRKAMNTFFCDTEKPFMFVGRINEDVNTYVTLNQRGKLMFTISGIMVVQKRTQSNPGGLSDIYLDNGTFWKSFYSVMYAPNCVKVSTMGDKHYRIHHFIEWSKCCPEILDQRYKKNKKKS